MGTAGNLAFGICGVALEPHDRLPCLRLQFGYVISAVLGDHYVAVRKNLETVDAFLLARLVDELVLAGDDVDATHRTVGIAYPIAMFPHAVDIAATGFAPDYLAVGRHYKGPSAAAGEQRPVHLPLNRPPGGSHPGNRRKNRKQNLFHADRQFLPLGDNIIKNHRPALLLAGEGADAL